MLMWDGRPAGYCNREIAHFNIAKQVLSLRNSRNEMKALAKALPSVPLPVLEQSATFLFECHLVVRFQSSALVAHFGFTRCLLLCYSCDGSMYFCTSMPTTLARSSRQAEFAPRFVD